MKTAPEHSDFAYPAFLTLEQGSDEWHIFRIGHKMASETPALLGASQFDPYTPLQLFEIKRGYRQIEDNPAMAFGRKHEADARRAMSEIIGADFEPVVVVGEDDYAASLDGWNHEARVLAEIKCPYTGQASHTWKLAAEGQMRPDYEYQLQHQMMVTNTPIAHFGVYDAASGEILVLTEKRNDALIEEIRAAWDAFWPGYLSDTAPEPSERDYVDIDTDEAHALMGQYLELSHSIKALEQDKEEARKRLIELAGAGCARIGEHKITRFHRRGNVNYKKVPELKDVDLDAYRAKGSWQYRIS